MKEKKEGNLFEAHLGAVTTLIWFLASMSSFMKYQAGFLTESLNKIGKIIIKKI